LWPNIGYYPRVSLGENKNYHGKPVRLLGVLADFESGASHVHERSVVAGTNISVVRIVELHDHSVETFILPH
jgi:hypothetical protein